MAFEKLNDNGKANIILISEHASNYIPPEYEGLGLSEAELELHIAWDIGIGEVTRNLSKMLDAPAILAGFSRLLIDANRGLDQDGLIPLTSDATPVPGNHGLSDADRQARIDRFYIPFHNAVDALVQNKSRNDHAPLIFNMHSFTPEMNGFDRPWHSGMLWNKDDRIANVLKERLEAHGCHVGDNEPYSGQELNHTMNTHGTKHGFPHVNVEIRQNEIDHQPGIEKWTRMLAQEINLIRDLPEMSHIKHF